MNRLMSMRHDHHPSHDFIGTRFFRVEFPTMRYTKFTAKYIGKFGLDYLRFLDDKTTLECTTAVLRQMDPVETVQTGSR